MKKIKNRFLITIFIIGTFSALLIPSSTTFAQHLPVISIDMGGNVDTDPINRVVISPDGSKAVIAQRTTNQEAALWNVLTGQIIRTYPFSEIVLKSEYWYPKMALDAAFSPDGKYILIQGSPSYATLYETETGKEIFTYLGKPDPRVAGSEQLSGACFSPDGRKILFHNESYSYTILDALTGAIIDGFSDRYGRPTSVTYLANGRDICIYASGWYYIINTETEETLAEYKEGIMALSPNSRYLSRYQYETQTLEITDLQTLQPILKNNVMENLIRFPIALSDELNILVGSRIIPDNTTKKAFPRAVINAKEMKKLFEYPVDLNAGKNDPTATDERIGFFPDGKRFYTVNGTKVHFWDISDLTSRVKNPAQY